MERATVLDHRFMPPDGKPYLELKVPGKQLQLNFSACPEPAGWDWAEVLQHRQVRVPPITILRVYAGTYGSEVLPTGEVRTGGLENHIQKLDRALAKAFPVTVHVAHRVESARSESSIKEPGWRGEIVLHPILRLGKKPISDYRKVMDLAEGFSVDLIHLHNPNNPLFLHLCRKSGTAGLAITYHSQFGGEAAQGRKPGRLGWRHLRLACEVFRDYVIDEGVLTGAALFMEEVGRQLRWRLGGVNTAKQEVYDLGAMKAESRYYSVGLVSVSRQGRGDFGERPGEVLGVPVDPEMFCRDKVTAAREAEIRAEFKVRPGEFIVMYHARLTSLKGQDLLPAVAAQVSRQIARPVRFVLIGPEIEAGFKQKLSQEIRRCGVQDQMVVAGAKSQEYVRDALAVADVWVFPTLSEGAGGSAMEALLMEVPVVAHSVGGVPEVVIDGQTGLLVPPLDKDAFANAVVRLLNAPDLRRDFGRKGRELISERFSADKIALDYMRKVYLPQIIGKNSHTADYLF